MTKCPMGDAPCNCDGTCLPIYDESGSMIGFTKAPESVKLYIDESESLTARQLCQLLFESGT